jgi:threonine/homoserine/homoserine lactone efflux protein
MLQADAENRVKEIEKEIIKVSLIDAPGSIMVGLGVYAKFAANGDAFHPLLNNPDVVTLLLVAGGSIMVWGAYKMVTLGREKSSLQRDYGL